MTWICPVCGQELGELNGWCEYCKRKDNTIVYNPDSYYIRDIRVSHIAEGAVAMTPQEEKFAKLFNHEAILVKDMDTLTLRAHIEELSSIAFEARARYTAATDEEKKRKKSSEGKPAGFSRSVNTDETSTAAINTIQERQKKLTKAEKLKKSLTELLGGNAADAEKLMSAGTILARLKDNKSKEILKGEEVRSPLSQENGFIMQKPEVKKEQTKPMFNPFDKK